MNYENFKLMLKERMQEIMGDSIEVEFESYLKNNLTEIESMAFRDKKPSLSVTISPAIHLKDLYGLYMRSGDGREFEDCLHLIKKLYKTQGTQAVDKALGSWDEIKSRVSMALIYEEWNSEWIKKKQVLYSRYIGFAITLRLKVLDIPSYGTGMLTVTGNLLPLLGVEETALWDAAWDNLNHEIFYIRPLMDEIESENLRLNGKWIKFPDSKSECPLYIMTNQERRYGSKAILRVDLLQEFAEKMECNLFILPSSIHEIILMPDRGACRRTFLFISGIYPYGRG